MERQNSVRKNDGDNPEDVTECRGSNRSDVSSSLPFFIVAIYKIRFSLKTGKEMKKSEQPEDQVPYCHCKLPLRMDLV